jgi:hypothetical protein
MGWAEIGISKLGLNFKNKKKMKVKVRYEANMNKISTSTNLGFVIIQMCFIYLFFDNKVSWWWLTAAPLFYLLMWFIIKVFIWDKMRQFDIRLSKPAFKVGDLIFTSGSESIILGVKLSNNEAVYTAYHVRKRNSKLLSRINLFFIKLSYQLRSVRL